MTTAEILRAARAKIDTPEKWTRGAYARTKSGRIVGPECASAVHLCAVGAVTAAASPAMTVDDALVVLARELPSAGGITNFNDHPGTTHADILALFDRAIAAAERAQ